LKVVIFFFYCLIKKIISNMMKLTNKFFFRCQVLKNTTEKKSSRCYIIIITTQKVYSRSSNEITKQLSNRRENECVKGSLVSWHVVEIPVNHIEGDSRELQDIFYSLQSSLNCRWGFGPQLSWTADAKSKKLLLIFNSWLEEYNIVFKKRNRKMKILYTLSKVVSSSFSVVVSKSSKKFLY
jgi:hypothetical protein